MINNPYHSLNSIKHNSRYSNKRYSKLTSFYQSKFAFKNKEAMTIQSIQNLAGMKRNPNNTRSHTDVRLNQSLSKINMDLQKAPISSLGLNMNSVNRSLSPKFGKNLLSSPSPTKDISILEQFVSSSPMFKKNNSRQKERILRKMELTYDYDQTMKNITSNYRLPNSNSDIFLTSTPDEIYSLKQNKNVNNKSIGIINPIKIIGVNDSRVENSKNEKSKLTSAENSEQSEEDEVDLLNKMQEELNLQESLADDLKHYLNYENIFDFHSIGSLASSLNEELPYEQKRNKDIAMKRFKLRRTSNRQNLDLYDPNRLIEVSDEEMLLKICRLETHSLNDKLTKWGIVSFVNRNYQNQRNDFLDNRPNKIRTDINK